MVAVARSRRERTGFAERLKAIRLGTGLTQAQLATAVGIPFQTVNKYERGVIEPSWPLVIRLARALNTTPDAFLGDDEPPHDVPPPEEPSPPPAGDRGGYSAALNDGKKGSRPRGGHGG